MDRTNLNKKTKIISSQTHDDSHTGDANQDRRLSTSSHLFLQSDAAMSSIIRHMNQNTESKQQNHHLMVLLDEILRDHDGQT